MKLNFTILFSCIVILYIGKCELLPNWAFTRGGLNITSKIIFEFSFLAMLLCIALLVKVNKYIIISISVIFTFAFIIMAWGEIYPIDTTTEPVDTYTIATDSKGQRLIIREYENAKTGSIIYDTVKVHDYFIFRKFVDR